MRTRIHVQIAASALLAIGSAQAEQPQSAIQQAAAQAEQTCRSAYGNPAIAPLLEKVTINVGDITLAMRANAQRATLNDKAALQAWIMARDECFGAWDFVRHATMRPEIYRVQRGVEKKVDSLIVDLSNGKLTYGEFNNGRIAAVKRGGREISAIWQKVNSPPQKSLIAAKSPIAGQRDTVPLEKVGDLYAVPVLINGAVPMKFEIDSGSAVVVVPRDVFRTLERTGTVTRSDVLDTRHFGSADGREIAAQRFLIRTLKVGGVTLPNVIAVVMPEGSDPLLGQSFLSRLRSWSMDNNRHVLVMN